MFAATKLYIDTSIYIFFIVVIIKGVSLKLMRLQIKFNYLTLKL